MLFLAYPLFFRDLSYPVEHSVTKKKDRMRRDCTTQSHSILSEFGSCVKCIFYIVIVKNQI